MKILIVRTFPDIMNTEGYNVQEIGLARALIVAGNVCDIILYNGKNKDRVQECTFEENGKIYYYRIYWLRGYNLLKNGFMPSAEKIIRQYDVIQVDEYDLIYSWRLYTWQIRPTVVYHGLYYSEYTRGYNLKCRVFDQMFLRWHRHDKVIALTKSEKATEFLRGKGFKHVHTAGVGLDIRQFENRGEKVTCPISPKGNKFRLLYVGKIEERRNSLFLLDVFQKLKEKVKNVELVVIGSGEKDYLKAFGEKAQEMIANGDLTYLKRASQRELALVYENCDLLLFPSNYEIFGMVLLEAMYFGLPVVSSDNGGSGTLIKDGENGRILHDFRTQSWTEAVEELLINQEKYNDMKEKAAHTIREGFLWEHLADKFIAAFEEARGLFEKKEF